jgi:hypothetical protein
VINKQSNAVLDVSIDGIWQAMDTSIVEIRREMVVKYKVDL